MTLTQPPKNRAYVQAQVLVEELVRHGVNTFFVAPGSRSTPLVAAVASNPKARTIVHFDERGSCFAALGFGRATGRPAAWITTSGTAVANGFPAIVEASVDEVPILLLTADRPSELRQTGANQTIDQVKIFGDYVRSFFDLPVPSQNEPLRTTVRVAAQAMDTMARRPGPVHINCPFREPFEMQNGGAFFAALTETDVDGLSDWLAKKKPLNVSGTTGMTMPVQDAIDHLRAVVGKYDKGLVVVGALPPDAPLAVIAGALTSFGWPILIDPLSQLRDRTFNSRGVVPYYDQLLAVDNFSARATPDAVVHIGGRLLSKALINLLNSNKDCEYVRIGARQEYNPGQRSCLTIGGDITLVLSQVKPAARRDESWLQMWVDGTAVVADIFSLDSNLAGEPSVARQLVNSIPDGYAVFYGNSMPIRDADRFGLAPRPTPVFANRGASGIDGLIATAFGVSVGRHTPVVAFVGDLSLLHDLNSLSLLNQSNHPVIVVVVNNDGGGIFSFLPIVSNDDLFEKYFGTPHGMTFDHAAAQFKLPYTRVSSPSKLTAALQDAYRSGKSHVIEVASNRPENRSIHTRVSALVASALEK